MFLFITTEYENVNTKTGEEILVKKEMFLAVSRVEKINEMDQKLVTSFKFVLFRLIIFHCTCRCDFEPFGNFPFICNSLLSISVFICSLYQTFICKSSHYKNSRNYTAVGNGLYHCPMIRSNEVACNCELS